MCRMNMSIPNFYLPFYASSQDKALMCIAVAMKTLISFKIHQLNIVRLNLKVILLFDILCEASRVVKTCYATGNTDFTISISCTWPATCPSHKANKI